MSLHVVAGQPLVYLLAAVNRSTGVVIAPDALPNATVYVNGVAVAGSMSIAPFVANTGNFVTFTPTAPFNAGDKINLVASATYGGTADWKIAATVAIANSAPVDIYSYFAQGTRPDIFKDGSTTTSSAAGFRWI
jgi:hypothetical protein